MPDLIKKWVGIDSAKFRLPTTAGGGGTVTSVDLIVPAGLFGLTGGPITTSGDLELVLNTQAANTFFAGPTSGGDTEPSFRPMVVADIPTEVVGAAGASGVVNLLSSAIIGQDCYYNAGVHSGDFGTTSLTGLSGLIVGASFVAGRTAVIEKIMCKIYVASAGGKARIGIYEEVSSDDIRPGALIYGSAEIDCSTTVAFTETVSGSPTLIMGRRYWLVAHTNANPIGFVSIPPSLLDPCFGRLGPAGSDIYPRWGVQGSQAYGALPATFPTVTILSSLSQPSVPCVGVSMV